ncbi:sugar transferase [Eggerthella lenta]|uniref:sugar transferase n=1 Tax=Eggerthella lenta TaxID=84112 RepID=UPI001EE1961C|nr:sugar transferase [Eggerthella lenta]
MVKFRNMTEDRDEDGELLPPEDRITRLGLFVRSHSLDELLNFWSVFKGDMSLIGPRPLPVEFTPHMTERHKMRYAVRPGLECPRVGDEEPEAGADFSWPPTVCTTYHNAITSLARRNEDTASP